MYNGVARWLAHYALDSVNSLICLQQASAFCYLTATASTGYTGIDKYYSQN